MKNKVDYILGAIENTPILDIGCTDHKLNVNSPHWLHGQIRRKFDNVTGIDINEKCINEMKVLGFNNLHIMNAENFCLPNKYKTIVAGDIIEHLSNPGLFLTSAIKHLDDDGVLIVSTAYAFSLLYFLTAFFRYPYTCSNKQHTCFFCPATIRELISRHGLEIVSLEIIKDYNFSERSLAYAVFVRLITLFGFFLPKRLKCNSLVVTLRRPIRT